MKRFLGLFFFAAFFSLTAAAETKDLQVEKPVIVVKTCTVTVSYPNENGGTIVLTVTATCNNCTQQAACNAAYAVLSIIIPG